MNQDVAGRTAPAHHPIQPLERDENGTLRFRANAIVRYLFNTGPVNASELRRIPFSREDWEQFYQQLGFSLEHAPVSEETRRAAKIMHNEGLSGLHARFRGLCEVLEATRAALRDSEAVPHGSHASRPLPTVSTTVGQEELIRTLRNFALGFPTTVFPPLSDAERQALSPGIVGRIYATMARHCGQLLIRAADVVATNLAASPTDPAQHPRTEDPVASSADPAMPRVEQTRDARDIAAIRTARELLKHLTKTQSFPPCCANDFGDKVEAWLNSASTQGLPECTDMEDTHRLASSEKKVGSPKETVKADSHRTWASPDPISPGHVNRVAEVLSGISENDSIEPDAGLIPK